MDTQLFLYYLFIYFMKLTLFEQRTRLLSLLLSGAAGLRKNGRLCLTAFVLGLLSMSGLWNTNVQAQCSSTAAFGSGAVNTSGAVVQLTTCAYFGENSSITGAVAGQNLLVTTNQAGGYLTVRSGNASTGSVIAFGLSPLLFTNNFTGTIYLIYNSNSSCGTGSVCNTGTVQLILPPCTAPTAQPTALTSTGAGSSVINASFTAAAGAPSGYLVVRYPAGATPTAPTNGLAYTTGNAIGTGTVVQAGTTTTFTSTGLAVSTAYDFYVYAYNVTPGTCSIVYLNTSPLLGTLSTTGPGTITSTVNGGLWSDGATWVGGAAPGAVDNVIIAANSVVTVNQVVTAANLTINGTLQWNATANAMTTPGNITIGATGRFLPYTTTAGGATGVTLNVGGNFTNNGYANLAVGTTTQTLLNFNGSQQVGGSLAQTLGGTGTFEGDGVNGIIRQLFFQTTGNSTINTAQNITTFSFAHATGNLNTNGKLRIDNTAQIHGRPINTQVASVHVTAMGSLYNAAPVVFGATVSPWVAGGTAAANTRYFSGGNIYLCTTAGTFDATNAPVNTTPVSETNGTATVLWIGSTGTLGNPFQVTAVLLNTQYFCGGNLYTCTAAGTPSVAAPPVHTSGTVVSGTASFRYVGSPARVISNYDATTQTVRSLTLVDGGTGYASSAAPGLTFNLGIVGGTGSGAAATSVILYALNGPLNSLVQKSGVATITGGMTINSDQGASVASADPQASSGVGAIFTASGGNNYTVAPTVGIAGPTALNLVTNGGSGYTAAPTITVTGGTLITGTALTSANFTITVNQGKVVSVYLNASTTATYSVPPTLTMSAPASGTTATLAFPAGCWPTATANIGANGQLASFTMTNSGYGYVIAPSVGVGTVSGTPAGGTFTTGATALTARVALYNLTLNFFTPALSAVVQADNTSIIPANRKLNNLSLAGNGNGLNLTSNLTLYGTAPLTLAASTSIPGNVLDLGGNNLYCSWNGYAGATSTFGGTNAYLKNGSMTIVGRGGGTTGSTWNFPFDATFTAVTGTGVGFVDGASITSLTVSTTAAPSGAGVSSGVASGTRAFRMVRNAGSANGTNPNVTLRFNSNDALLQSQNYLTVGQSAALTGPWDIRSAAYGVSGALPAAGLLTTPTIAPGPIVPTGDDYFAWMNTAPAPVITAFANVAYTNDNFCTGGGEIVSIDGTGFAGTSSVTFNGQAAASFVVNSATSITAVTPSGITAGSIAVVANGVSGTSLPYTVYNSGTITLAQAPSNGLICEAGGSVALTISGLLGTPASYDWTGGTGSDLDTYTGLSVVASPTTSTQYTFTATYPAQGCNVVRNINVGFITSTPFTPTATPAVGCIGSTVSLNAGISAGNFGVAAIIPAAPVTVPSTGVTTIVANGVANVPLSGGSLDDGGWSGIPIGFSYNFFGTTFSSISAGTNGLLMFGPVPGYSSAAGQLGQYSFNTVGGVFPNINNPGNVIALMAADQYFGSGTAGSATGTLKYWNDGVAPTRRFIIQYENVNSCCGAANPTFTAQAVLFETTGIVEIHILSKNNSAASTVGLQDATKTIGAVAPGRQAFTALITTPESWRFSPPANYTYSWAPSAGLTPNGTSGVVTTPTLTAAGSQSYAVTVLNPLTTCSSTENVTFDVRPRPTSTITGGGTVCNGATQPDLSVALTGIAPWSLTYSDGSTPTLVTGLTASPYTIVGAGAGTYTITAAADSTCAAQAGDMTGSSVVVVNPRPTAVVSGGATVCPSAPLPSVTFTLTGTGPWSLSYSDGTNTISASPTVSPFVLANAPVGTYTVTALSDANCAALPGDLSGTATSAIGAALTAGTITTSAVICNLANFTATANTTGGAVPYTYSWGGSGSGNTQDITLNLAAGTYNGYNCTVTDGCGGIVVVSSPIVVNPSPTPAIAPTPANAAICSGSPASVALDATGGVTYSWYPSINLSATSGASVSAAPGATTVYSVEATDANGCKATTTQSVGVGTAVTMGTVSATPAAICPGDASALSASATEVVSAYCIPTYSSGTGFGDYVSSVSITGTTLSNATAGAATPYYTLFPATGSTTATLTAGSTYTIVLSPGTYTSNDLAAWIDYNANGILNDAGEKLGETDDLGATPATTSFTFTVPANAINGTARLRVRDVDHSGVNDMDPCLAQSSFGETEDYTVTITGGVTPGFTGTYSWTPSTFLGGTTSATASATNVTATTTYTVTASNAVGCNATGTVTVTVNPNPIVAISPTPANALICSGSPANIALAATGGVSYSWYPAGGLSTTSGASVSAAPGVTTVYSVEATDANGCKATTTQSVVVGDAPVISTLTATPAAVCPGGSSTLFANTGEVAPSPYCIPTYSSGTSFGDYVSSVSITGTTLSNATVGAASPYYTLFPATGSTTATLTAGSTYTIVLSAGTYTQNDLAAWIDYNANGVLNDVGEKLGETDNLGATPASTSFTFTVPANAINGTARLRVRDVDHGGVNDMDPCLAQSSFGETEDYNITITGGVNIPITYTWTPSTFLGGTTGPTVSATNVTTATTYTVTATTSVGCNTTGTVSVAVNPNPIAAISPTPANALICSGSPANIALAATGGVTYSWYPAAGLSTTSGASVSAAPSSTTVYSVEATDANGCKATTTQSVVVGAAITMGTVSATPAAICPGGASTLSASATETAPSAYCVPTYSNGTGFGDYVTSVSITGTTLSNATGASASPFYTLFPATGSTTATLTAGSTYTIVLSAGTYTQNDLAAWIDYNANGILNDAGEKLGETNNLGASPASTSFTFTIPANAINGTARLRVREMDYGGTNIMDPCLAQSTFGEVEDYNITITGGANPLLSYSWTPSTFLGGTTSATASATNVTVTTTYTVTASNAVGCSATGTATVTVNTLPTASIAGTTSVCQNATAPNVTFTGATGAAPYTFTYNINGGSNLTVTTISGNSVTVSAPTGTTGAFAYNLVSVSDANTCSQAQTGTATVTVNTLPTASISGTTTVCQNGTAPDITFTGATGAAPYTFTYNINGGSNLTVTTTSGNSVTVSASTGTAGAFAYNLVSVADANTCSQAQTGTATVTVNTLPTASISGTTTVCQNGTAPDVTFTGATGTAPYTFTYKINGGSDQTVTTTSGNSVAVSATTSTNGTFAYTLVSVSDGNTCSQAQTGTATVTVDATAVAVAGSDVSTCATTQVTLSPTTPPAGTGVWTGGLGTWAGNNYTPTAGESNSSITVTWTVTNGTCSATDVAVVVIDTTAPTITFAPGNQTLSLDSLCSSVLPNYTTMATANDNCSGYVVTQSPVAGTSVYGSGTTTVVLTVTDAANRTATTSFDVTRNLFTPTIVAGGATTFCNGGSVTLQASNNAAYSYQWYKDAAIISGANSSSFLADASGSYNVDISVTGGCTLTSNAIVVNELAVPAAPTITTNPAAVSGVVNICSNGSVTMTGSSAAEYLWYKNGVPINYSLSPNYTVSSAGTNVYTLVVVPTGSSCISSQSSPITVIRSSLTPTISLSGPTSFCSTTPTTLSANPVGVGYSYVWEKGSIPVGTLATYTPTVSGNYSLVVTDSLGCSVSSGKVSINILSTPPANAGLDKSVCSNLSTIIGSTSSTLYSYSWSPSTGLSSATASKPVVSPTTTGTTTYVLTVTNNTTGCSKTDSVNVTGLALPSTPSLSGTTSPVCQGSSVVLTPTVPGATLTVWYKNGVGLYTKPSTTNATFTAVTSTPDSYTIKGRNAAGCLSTNFSNAVSVMINEAPTPTITSNPAAVGTTVTICNLGGTTGAATLTGNSTAISTPTYSWQQLVGTTYTNVSAGNSYVASVATTPSTSNNKSFRVQATYPNGCVKTSSTTKVRILTSGCTPRDGDVKGNSDLTEIVLESDLLTAYPNPTDGILNVGIENCAASEGKLVLYNALGQIVTEVNMTIINGKAVEILDLRSVAAGVYTLSFQTETSQKVQKVVKE